MRVRVREVIVGALAAVAVASALSATPALAAATDPIAYADAITPNDPGYPAEWGVVKARVNQAWSATRGSSRVVIAVVDTGVTATADLAGRVLPGHDFVNGDDDARDDNGHGTMAAEVIAAAGNNRVGIAGVCGACRILPVKVLGKDGSGAYSNIADGIRYAADQGATVVNLSLGGSDDSPVLRDAVAYAAGKGALVIGAAGNDGSAAPHYPAAIPAVLAVGGVTSSDTRYSWSNYGSWVDVTAPGCNPSQALNGVVMQYCGTSSATPFTAGVAGLLASTDPAPTAAQIRSAIVASRAAGGRIDAVNALNALPYAGDTTKPALVFGTRSASGRTVSVTAAAADQHGVAKVQLFANGKLVGTDTRAPYAFKFTAKAKGTMALQIRAYDRAGNAAVTARSLNFAG
jgi:subtilisin family serine protease